MGYSCTAKAQFTLDAIAAQIGSETSNGMPDGGFWEVGRENEDGAITGTVWKPYDDTRVTRRGSFRIEPNGKVRRFPGIARNMLDSAELTGAAKYRETYKPQSDYRRDARQLANFLNENPTLATYVWNDFQTIVGQWQSAKKISFAVLPTCEAKAMSSFLDEICA